MKTCLNCGQTMPDNASFCGNCGALVPDSPAASAAPIRFCPNCGERLESSGSFCPSCGSSVSQRSPASVSPAPPPRKGRFQGLAIGAAVVALVAAAAVFLLPKLMASPAKQFVQIQADFLSARMLEPAQKAVEIYGSGKFSTDMTLTASVDNAEINQYLQDSAVKLRMDLNGTSLLADGELSLMGTTVLTGALTYDAGRLGFCLPQADNTYYVMDLPTIYHEMTGEDIDLENLSAPAISAEDCMELLKTYGGILSGAVSEDNVLEAKQLVPFSQLGGSFQGTVYIFRPRAQDFQDVFVQLANQLERDQTLRRVILEGARGSQLGIYSEQELVQEIDRALRSAASELRTAAKEASSSTENFDFAWTVGIEGKQLRKIEISMDGEAILGYEMKGDEATGCEEIFYASSYGEVASIRSQYTRQGSRVSGRSEISAGYNGSAALSFDVDTSKTSVLGLYCGTYDFDELFALATGGDFTCRLDVRESAGGSIDHILTIRGDESYFDYMFSKLELTINTTGQSSVQAPSASKVDISGYSDWELQALFERLSESLAADLQDIANELALYVY